jgi:phage shock protein C
MKKLYKSKNDKVLSGLIGGLGEYFDVDPVLIRLGFVVVVFITGFFPGVIAYIIGVLIVPNHPSDLKKAVDDMKKENIAETKEKVAPIVEVKEEPKEPVINL